MNYLENHNILLTICSYLSMIMSAVFFGASFVGGVKVTSNKLGEEKARHTVRAIFLIIFLGSIQGVL